MIKFEGEQSRLKTARTEVPDTAEFKPFRDASGEDAKSQLIDRAAAAFGRFVDTHPDQRTTTIRPDEVYDQVLREGGLQQDWQNAFGGDQKGRDLFGLVAWTYFFKHDADWMGTPAQAPGLGKLGWTYSLRCGGFRLGQCVERKSTRDRGRVISGPDFDCFYQVRFKSPPVGGPGPVQLVPDDDIDGNIQDESCRGISGPP
jgi:hypothetical protein